MVLENDRNLKIVVVAVALIGIVGSILGGGTVLELIRDLGVLTIVAGLIGYVVREAIRTYFNKQEQDFQGEIDKEVQKFQNDLEADLQEKQADFEKEIQRVQSELEKEQIVFSGLHEQRAEIVSEFYAKMNEFDEDMRNMVDPFIRAEEMPREEKIDTAAESGEEFRRYYKKNKIYFPTHICETAEDLIDEYREMFQDFSISRIHDEEESRYDDEVERMEKWVGEWNSLTNNEIPELREELENHFRELLGVDTEMRSENEVEEATEVEGGLDAEE